MSEYNQLDCECGHSYFTKSVAAKCPNCGKNNWTATGALIGILLAVGVAIFVGMMLGPLIYAWYARKELGKNHGLYAAISGTLMAAIWIYFINEPDGNETMGYIGLALNGVATVLGVVSYRQSA